MWVVTLCFCIMLITSATSNPLKNTEQKTSDDFYKALRFAFDKFMGQKTSEFSDENDSLHSQEDILDKVIDKGWDDAKDEKKSKRESIPEDPFKPHDLSPETGLTTLYPCDKYEEASHICTNVRQIGTTLTLGIQAKVPEKPNQQRIRWYRYFKRLGSLSDIQEEFTKDNLPWNINIGGESNELRISPVTEIDFSYNYFVATISSVQKQKGSPKHSNHVQFIKFIIEPINIDMGTLYPGEELVIYARAFMELPKNSLSFSWTLNNSEYGLPSNMKINADGASVIVKELRTTADKVLTCSVFSNKNIFLGRRNFLFRKIGATNDGELQNTLQRQEFFRRKRSLDENEGFEDDDDIFQRPQLSFPESHRQKYNEDYNFYGDRILIPTLYASNRGIYSGIPSARTKSRTDDQVFYANDPQTVSHGGEPIDFRKNKPDNYQFSRTKTFEQSPSQRNQAVVEPNRMDQYSEFAHSQYDRVPIQKDEPVDGGELRDDGYPSNLLHKSRSKKDTPSLMMQQDPKNEISRLNELIQQANLIAQQSTEKSIPYIDEAVNNGHSQMHSFDDVESTLIADCKDHFDCSIHATCNKKSDGHNFCRCFPQYRGNGIFCWLI